MTTQRKVAIVTGASRGIGMAGCLHLARKGFDIVACSRTLRPGEAFEMSPTGKASDVVAMPGSLEETAEEVRRLGGRALAVKLDLLERGDAEGAVQRTLEEFGRIDLLVNNGRYFGPGHYDALEDTEMVYLDRAVEANTMAPLLLTKLVMPVMIERGGGTIINLTSSSGYRETPAMPGEGGWGLNYSISKAAIGRAGPGLAKELRQYNISVINLLPGFVAVERTVRDAGRYGFDPNRGLSIDVPGAAIAFLATHPYPMYFSGRELEAVDLCVAHQLVDPETLPAAQGPAVWGLPKGSDPAAAARGQ